MFTVVKADACRYISMLIKVFESDMGNAVHEAPTADLHGDGESNGAPVEGHR